MTRLTLLTIALSFSFSPLSAMASPEDMALPTQVPVKISTVYAPVGFDSNDNVQIVAEGFFPNSCYRPGPMTFKVDQNRKVIELKPMAYHYSGMCLQVILPFERVVDLGILKAGEYSVVQSGSGDKLEVLKVARTTSRSADDYLYAPISQAFVRQTNGATEIELTGEFSNSCMRLDDVKMLVQPKVIVIQPIAVMDGGSCQNGKFPFSKIIPVQNAPKGRYLLHVRSMNAKAINTLIDIE